MNEQKQITLSARQQQLLACLRNKREGSPVTDKNGVTWDDVYLDNVRIDVVRSDGVLMQLSFRDPQLRGDVSALKRAGLYQPSDDPEYRNVFGFVRVEV